MPLQARIVERTAPLLAAGALFLACETQPAPDDAAQAPPAAEEAPRMDEAARGPEMAARLSLVSIGSSPFQPGPAAQGRPIGGTLHLLVPQADAAAVPEGTHVAARVEGLEPGAHAWHVHRGACGQPGPIIVPFTPTAEQPGIDQPISADQQGTAEAFAFIPSELLSRQQIEAGQYSVHVHERAGTDHGPTVACADLRATGAPRN